MNVLNFELNKTKTSMILWTSVLLGLLVMFMLWIFPIYENASADLKIVLDQFPPVMSVAFGLNDEIFSILGFYQFSSLYLSIGAIAMAVNLTLNIIFREKIDRTYEFILVRPLSKTKLLMYKFLSIVIWLLLFNVLYLLIFYWLISMREPFTLAHAWIGIANFFLQGLGVGLAFVYGMSVRKIRSIPIIATALALFVFILNTLSNLIDPEKLSYISPLSSFEALKIIKSGFYVMPHFLILLTIIFGLLLYGSAAFVRMEVGEY